jgi:hypothetical protein
VGTEKKEDLEEITTAIEKLAQERKLHLIKPLVNMSQ